MSRKRSAHSSLAAQPNACTATSDCAERRGYCPQAPGFCLQKSLNPSAGVPPLLDGVVVGVEVPPAGVPPLVDGVVVD